jgi:aryl-alcohol dehydrogenase-like predicted oxidoreductase
MMEYTRLGDSDLVVSRLGFGCEPLGGADWGKVDDTEVMAAVSTAVELGINFFDTADVYGLSRSEQLLAQALGNRRNDVVIASKFGVNWSEDPAGGRARTFYDSSPRRVVEALENSLRRLRIDCIPLYLIHWPDPSTPIAETIESLLQCQRAGKIKYIGLSNFPPCLIREVHQMTRLTAVELPYNLVDRQAERELLPCCEELGISVLAYGPLAQGLLTGKYDSNARFDEDDRRHRLGQFQGKHFETNLQLLERTRTVGSRYQRSPAQVAIRWVLEKPAISCAISGVKSSRQIEENVGALGWRLREEDCEFMANGGPGSYRA